MKTFVVPDLHGRFDLLVAALDYIHKIDTSGTVVFLGDYVDRGPQSKSIISHLIEGPPEGWRWVCLKGNHEDMLLGCHKDKGSDYQWWVSNGGGTTMASYDGWIDLAHREWIAQLPRIHYDDHRVYVHAGVGEHYELDQQPEQMTQWYRYPQGADIGYRNRHVVHGHTPQGPELFKNRTNLDAKAFSTGVLCLGMFDDETPGGPISVIKIKPINV